MSSDFEQNLQRYAQIIIEVGLNLRAGQRLAVNAPIEAAPLVRAVTASAYQAGARLVDVNWWDDQVTLARYRYAPRDSFEEFPAYRAKAMEEYVQNGEAFLSIYATDPDLLKDQDPALIQLAQKTAMKHNKGVSELLSRNASNWCVVTMPVPAWAARVFPDLPPSEQMARLWEAIFAVTRVSQGEPVSLWKQHVEELAWRSDYLNRKQYPLLHITGPGTDLKVGLPAGHRWMGGQITSQNGITFIPNLPTEEIFTLPDRSRVEGVVRSSLPLNYAGTVIENFSLEFQDGQVVSFQAEKGEETLRELLNTDEGARRLGEIALVPHRSPVSDLGILFYNTLFDENAASHLALGRAYTFTLNNSEALSEEEFVAAGGNISLTHVDFMIGAADTNIDGILPDGRAEPVMRAGAWAFGH